MWRENGRARALILASGCTMRDLGCFRDLGTYDQLLGPTD